jgi:hypothetical protein
MLGGAQIQILRATQARESLPLPVKLPACAGQHRSEWTVGREPRASPFLVALSARGLKPLGNNGNIMRGRIRRRNPSQATPGECAPASGNASSASVFG